MGYVEQMVNEHVASGTGRRLKLGPVTGRNPHQTLALGRKRQIQHEKYGNPTVGVFLVYIIQIIAVLLEEGRDRVLTENQRPLR